MRFPDLSNKSGQAPEEQRPTSFANASGEAGQSTEESSPTPKLSAKQSLAKARAARFETEFDIIEAIDLKQAFIKRLRFEAGTLDQSASDIFGAIQEWPPSEAKDKEADRAKALREEANAKRSRADHIESTYLSRLKGRLAVFRTDQLPAIDNKDRSVPK